MLRLLVESIIQWPNHIVENFSKYNDLEKKHLSKKIDINHHGCDKILCETINTDGTKFQKIRIIRGNQSIHFILEYKELNIFY